MNALIARVVFKAKVNHKTVPVRDFAVASAVNVMQVKSVCCLAKIALFF
jgi:hypothetical protein